MLLVPQTAAATWRVLCALFACYFHIFPWLLVLLFLQVVVVFFVLLFPRLVRFKCLPHLLRGGHDSFFSFFFFFCFFPFLRFVCFVVFLFCFVSFFSIFIECVCRACCIQYNDMTLHCPLLIPTVVLTAYRYVAT